MSYPQELAKRIAGVEASPTLRLTAKVRELKAAGVPVISFSAGEPHFDPPRFIYDAAHEALTKPYTKYTAVPGMPEARAAVSNWVNKTYRRQTAADWILCANGAKGAIHAFLQAVLSLGDEVIYQSPYWVSYPSMIHFSEGRSVIVPTTEANKFKITPEALRKAITPRTKVFLFNSPNNPTGVAYTQDEINALATVLADFPDIWILSDDIYDMIMWDAKKRAHFAWAPALDPERVVQVQGLSKSHAVTGWRIGFLCAPPKVAAAAALVTGHCQSHVPTVSQLVLKAAYQQDMSFLIAWVAYYENNLKLAMKILSEQWRAETVAPDGAFYVFPGVRQLYQPLSAAWKTPIDNDVAFCEAALEHARVGMVPGSAFGCPDYVRITTSTTSEHLSEGLNRIAAAASAV